MGATASISKDSWEASALFALSISCDLNDWVASLSWLRYAFCDKLRAIVASSAPLAVPALSPSVKRHGHAKVTFKIHWKHRRHGRRPHYIAATARSISISINGGVPQYANSPTSAVIVSAPGAPTRSKSPRTTSKMGKAIS